MFQPGVQVYGAGEGVKMTGFVQFGKHDQGLYLATRQNVNPTLATQIMQVIAEGFDGVRVPLCYFVTAGVKAGHLVSLIRRLINNLYKYDFVVDCIGIDGASTNRAFQSLICEPLKYFAKCTVDPLHKIFIIMDIKHGIKKIRNSLFSSGTGKNHSRLLKLDRIYIK